LRNLPPIPIPILNRRRRRQSAGASQQLVTPVMRGLRLLRFIAEGGSTANLSEVGRRIDVNRVTVMRLLDTLEHEGMVERLPQGGHTVGFAFLKMASRVLAANDLTTFARRAGAAQRVAAAVGLSGRARWRHVLYLLRDMPNTGLVSNIQVGSRVPAHLTTPGRMLLAHLARRTARTAGRRSAADGHEAEPGHARTAGRYPRGRSGTRLRMEFSAFEPGIDSCAAGYDAAANVIAAISVAGPQQRFEADGTLRERTEKAVKAAARDLSALLGYRNLTRRLESTAKKMWRAGGACARAAALRCPLPFTPPASSASTCGATGSPCTAHAPRRAQPAQARLPHNPAAAGRCRQSPRRSSAFRQAQQRIVVEVASAARRHP
jgi:DNA-binding IclR family transcriptional regulator